MLLSSRETPSNNPPSRIIMKKIRRTLYLLAIPVAFPLALSAQTIILQDNFVQPAGSPASILGQTPATIASSISSNEYVGTSSFEYTGSDTVEFNYGGNQFRGNFFDIAAATGATDILTVTADVKLTGGSGWYGIGFATGVNASSIANNTPWALFRSDTNANPGSGELFAGPGTANSTGFDPGANWTTGAFNTVALEYDPNDDGDGNGVARIFVNGNLILTETDMAGASTSPGYLMMGASNMTDTEDVEVNSLTVTIPEPSSALLLALAAGSLVLSRRRRSHTGS
jgi:hypothetical protein